jgi:ubiquinone/menaquinone biosynthesis C-methylase UbiE
MVETKEEKEAALAYNNMGTYYHHDRTKRYPQGWFYNELLEMPATLELLGNVKGKKILDFGCGTGIYAKLLTKKGAKVSGFDISKTMLDIAKKENPKLDLKFGSGYKIPFKEKFDIVNCSLVLEHIKDWNKAFKEVYRVLKPNGIFVFSINNPVGNATKRIKNKGKKYTTIQDYFSEKVRYISWTMNKGLKNEMIEKVPNYHKTYETIINIILRNKFELIGYKDAIPIEKAKKLFPKRYYTYNKIPSFTVWKLKKRVS